MTRENKLVMIVGFGFLLFLGILVSDHLAANTTPLKQELVRYTPEPRALPGENERFGTKPVAVAPPTLPTDEQSGIRIVQAGEQTVIGAGNSGLHGLAPDNDHGARQGWSPSQPSGERTHKVAKGEHPGDIAKRYYGKSSLGVKLAEYNKIDPKTLRIGQELKIPDIAVLDPSLAPQGPADLAAAGPAVVPPSMLAPGQGAPMAADTAASAKFGTVKVREGDNLYRIAAKVYGDGSRWEEIARLNGLGEGRKLKPGMEIKYALAE